MREFDLAVIGAGIVGLAHAYQAAKSGLKVIVFDRDAVAKGASVRNFGMLAIVAQTPGEELVSARQSLADWQKICSAAGIGLEQAGCLFLARTPEEMSVLSEAAKASDMSGHRLELLMAANLTERAPVDPNRFLGGLWSPDAWKVDQRRALGKIAGWLHRDRDVVFNFSTCVTAAHTGRVETTAGACKAGHVLLCGGDEIEALFPEAFKKAGIGRCQLQMMRTSPQPDHWKLAPFLLGGLSLSRYGLFSDCPSLPDLNDRQQQDQAEYLAHGIHLVTCQEADGSVTIGDSHDYGAIEDHPRSALIDDLIEAELARMIALPAPRIEERWIGHYAQRPGGKTLRVTPEPGVTIVTLTNGQGMTHGFSEAAKTIAEIFG